MQNTSRELSNEMTYLLMALYWLAMIIYMGQEGHMPRISYMTICSFDYSAFFDRGKLVFHDKYNDYY